MVHWVDKGKHSLNNSIDFKENFFLQPTEILNRWKHQPLLGYWHVLTKKNPITKIWLSQFVAFTVFGLLFPPSTKPSSGDESGICRGTQLVVFHCHCFLTQIKLFVFMTVVKCRDFQQFLLLNNFQNNGSQQWVCLFQQFCLSLFQQWVWINSAAACDWWKRW